MTTVAVLIVDIIIFDFILITLICSGYIIYIFSREKKLYKNAALRLTMYMAVTDFVFALTITPHMIFLTYSWNSNGMDLDPYVAKLSGTPMFIQLKVSLLLTIAVAVERNLALFVPLLYRKLSAARYAAFALILAYAFATLDLLLDHSISPIQRKPNCAALGCFVSRSFLTYWGASNMVLNLLVIILTVIIVVKLRLLEKNTTATVFYVGKEDSKYKQGNRSSLWILFISLFCITIPTIIIGIMEMNRISFFMNFGPFYIILLLVSGTCNSTVFLVVNRDVRETAKNLKRRAPAGEKLTTIKTT